MRHWHGKPCFDSLSQFRIPIGDNKTCRYLEHMLFNKIKSTIHRAASWRLNLIQLSIPKVRVQISGTRMLLSLQDMNQHIFYVMFEVSTIMAASF